MQFLTTIFILFFKWQKIRIVTIEASGHGFYGSIARQCLQKQCKNYPKIHGPHNPPPEYAT